MARYLYRAHTTGSSSPGRTPADKAQELLDLVAAEADAADWELFSIAAVDGELVGFARRPVDEVMPFGAS